MIKITEGLATSIGENAVHGSDSPGKNCHSYIQWTYPSIHHRFYKSKRSIWIKKIMKKI